MYLNKIEKILLFLTLLLLPSQIGKHFWPSFSAVYSLPVDYLSPTLYVWDVLVLALFLTATINFFKPAIGLVKMPSKLAVTLLLVFLLTQVLSLIPLIEREINIGAGLVRFEQYLISGIFAIYLTTKTPEFLKKQLFLPLVVGLLFVSSLAIAQFIKQGTVGFWIFGERTFFLSTPAIAKFDFWGQQFLRPYATFPHPNVFAGYLVLVLPLILMLAVSIKQKRLLGLTILVSVGALFLTVSRIAIIAGITGTVFFINRGVINRIKNWKLFIPLISIFLLVTPFLYTRFSSTFTFDAISFFRREGLDALAIELFTKFPLVGVGLNNFIPAIAEQLIVGPSRFLQPVHNIFLLTLSETGVLGFLGLLLFILVPIYKLIKMPSRNYQAQVFLLSWIIIIFLGFFDHYLLTLPQGYRLLFFVWGLSLAFAKNKGGL